MDSYERLLKTVALQRPDRPPLELMATDRVVESLCRHLHVRGREELLHCPGVDFRRIDLQIDKRQPLPEAVRSIPMSWCFCTPTET
jgi:hypothetical protein